MLTNVLKSLVSRAEIYDPETGEPWHPLLAQPSGKNVLLIVVTGDKRPGRSFQCQHPESGGMRFIATQRQDKNLEIETIGRKGRDFLRRRYRTAEPQNGRVAGRRRKPPSSASRSAILNKIDYALASELAERVIERYSQRGN